MKVRISTSSPVKGNNCYYSNNSCAAVVISEDEYLFRYELEVNKDALDYNEPSAQLELASCSASAGAESSASTAKPNTLPALPPLFYDIISTFKGLQAAGRDTSEKNVLSRLVTDPENRIDMDWFSRVILACNISKLFAIVNEKEVMWRLKALSSIPNNSLEESFNLHPIEESANQLSTLGASATDHNPTD